MVAVAMNKKIEFDANAVFHKIFAHIVASSISCHGIFLCKESP